MNDLLKAFIPSGRLIEAVPSDKTLLGKFICFPFRLIPLYTLERIPKTIIYCGD